MSLACPSCGQDVPVVLRAGAARCTACGATRAPFAAKVLNITGQPAKIGGTAAKVAGGVVWTVGTFVALLLMLVIQAVWPAGWLGFAIGIPIEFLTIMMGAALFFGGRMLGKAGDAALSDARITAIRGLARHKKGVLRAIDVAKSLHVKPEQADAMLTELAKKPEEDVGIDINDEGEVLYLFDSPDAHRFRVRVEAAGLGTGEIPAEIEEEHRRLKENEAG